MLAGHSAKAATFYWDNNGVAAGFGTAAGIWGAPTTGDSTQGWSTDATGVTLLGSVTTALADAINFGTATVGLAAGTVTVSGTVDSGNITFGAASGAVVISGGTLNLAATTTITVNNGADTISSAISGVGTSLVKAGAGTLTLSGSNTFSGTLNHNAGVLNINSNTALGSSLLSISNANTTFDNTSGGLVTIANNIIANNNTIFSGTNALTTTGVYTYNSGNRVLQVNGAGALTIGSLAGTTNPLRKRGTGTLAITGASTAAGIEFDTAAGVVLIGDKASLGSGNLAVITAGSGTLQTSTDLTGANKIANGVTLTGTGVLTVSGVNNFELGGVITGTGKLAKNGVNTVTLSAANTHSGGTSIDGGTMVVSGAGTLGASTGALTFTGNNTVLDLGTTTQNVGSLTAGSTATNINVAIPSAGGALNVSGNMIYQGGAGNGGTYTSNPTMTVGSSVAVSGSTLIGRANLLINGGTFSTSRFTSNAGGSTDWARLSIAAGDVTATNGVNGTFGTTGSNGTGATFQVELNGGTLSTPSIKVANRDLGGAGPSATNDANLIWNGGTVKVIGGNNANFVQVYGDGGNGTNPTQATYVSSGGANINTNGFDIGIAVKLLGNPASLGGGLAKTGLGTLTLAGANTFSGATVVTNGTLALAGSGAVNGSSSISVNGANAKFLHGGVTPISAVVNLTQGTVTGSGTIDTVNAAAGTGAIISNNNGAAGAALTIGNLTLAGAANINLFSNTTGADLIVGTLTNDSASGAVTITANNVGGWTNGATYTLIGYTTLAGSGANNFAHAVNNLSGRQFATWGDTGAAITLAIAGDNPVWTGAAGNGNWNGATVNWKLVNGGIPTQFLATDDVLFDDTATGPTAIDIHIANVAPNTTTFNNTTAKDYTLGSSGGFGITSGSLTKNNNGKLTITNANTHTGGTTLNAGTLNVNNSSALGAATGLFTINGGTLDNTLGTAITTNSHPLSINGDFTFTGTNALNLGAGASTLGAAVGTSRTITVNASTLTLGGPIADGVTANSIVKNGAGALVLSGANSFTGGVTLNAGTLSVNDASALGASGGLLTINGGVLDNTSGSPVTTSSRPVSLNGDFIFTGSNALTIAGSVGSTLGSAVGASRTITVNASALTLGGGFANGATADSIVKEGAGALVLTGASTFTGTTTINAGTVIAQNNLALGSSISGTTVASGATLDLGGTLAAGAFNLGTEALTVSGTGVGGNGALVNNGINDQGNATGRIVLAGDTAFGGIKRWDLRSSSPTLDMGGFNITKVGTNQVSLVGVTVNNPGNISIDGGSFGVETGTSLGGNAANSITINPAATLIFFANSFAIPWTVFVNGGTISQNNGSTTIIAPVVLGSGANTINVGGASLVLDDVVTGASGFTKTGGGSVTLNGTNDYAGLTTINGGRVLVGNSDGLGGTALGTTVAAGGTLQVINGIATNAGEAVSIAGAGTDAFGALQAGAGNGTWQGGITLADAAARLGATTGNTLTVTGSIADGGGNALTISGQLGTGTVVLNPTAPNTYTGPTSIVRGVLSLGKNNALPTGTVLDVDLANSVTDAATFDLAGFSQEVAGLRDTATTNVNGLVSNSGAAASTLTVNAASDFVYDGAISANIIVTKEGAGTQTLRGALSFTTLNQNDGRTNLDSALANAVITANGGRLDLNANANNSAVTVNNTATANVTVSQTLASLTINDGGTVVLGNPAPPAPPEFGETTALAGVAAVPEPGSAALLLGGILTLLGSRRRFGA